MYYLHFKKKKTLQIRSTKNIQNTQQHSNDCNLFNPKHPTQHDLSNLTDLTAMNSRTLKKHIGDNEQDSQRANKRRKESKKRMSLSDVPREILLEIVDHLDCAGINVLARTNKQIYDFLNDRLYRRDAIKSPHWSLRWGVSNGVEATVERALAAGQYLNPILDNFNQALQLAVCEGHVRFVEPNSFEDFYEAPLFLAAKRGHSAVFKLLLTAIDSGVDIDARVKGLLSDSLVCSCWKGHVSIVRQLLARDDVDINYASRRMYDGFTVPPFTRSEFGCTPLTIACHRGNAEIINLLVAKEGIDVNFCDIGGVAPLMAAVDKGFVGAVESLLARDDLDPNIIDSSGDHVLGYAVSLGQVDVVKLLLGHPKIDPNFASEGGVTALMLACTEPNMAKLLLDHEEIDVNRQNDEGRTALCEAAYYGCLESAKLLLEREDTDTNISDISGKTALFWACLRCEELVDLLLEQDDIDANARDINGSTPLAFALSRGSGVAIVRSLLSHRDTDPNAVDNDGVSIFSNFINNWRRGNKYADEIELLLCGRC